MGGCYEIRKGLKTTQNIFSRFARRLTRGGARGGGGCSELECKETSASFVWLHAAGFRQHVNMQMVAQDLPQEAVCGSRQARTAGSNAWVNANHYNCWARAPGEPTDP